MKRGRKRSPQANIRTPLQEQAAASLEALVSQFTSSKLILTHPGGRCRNLLLSALVENPMCELFYYDLGMEDASLSQLLAGLTYNLAQQATAFGSGTREALASGTTDPERLAEVFARDLEQIGADDFLLVLDEVDRIDSVTEIQTFLKDLLDFLPPQCHILISSRTLPTLPWERLVASRQAVILCDAEALPDGFYAERPGENLTLEAYALGPGYILLNGRLVEDWKGHLQQVMLFFALDRPKCTRADICQALWPELSIDQAVNVFHVTKRRLHSAFGWTSCISTGCTTRSARASTCIMTCWNS